MTMLFESLLIVGCICGAAIVIAATTYGCWASVRVLRLRQDLFAIRDDLFDEFVHSNCVDDKGYRSLRDQLNGLIAFAHLLSMPAVIRFARSSTDGEPSRPATRNEAAIENAERRMHDRVHAYLTRETLTGFVVHTFAKRLSWQNALRNDIARAVENSAFRSMATQINAMA